MAHGAARAGRRKHTLSVGAEPEKSVRSGMEVHGCGRPLTSLHPAPRLRHTTYGGAATIGRYSPRPDVQTAARVMRWTSAPVLTDGGARSYLVAPPCLRIIALAIVLREPPNHEVA